mgnify:CR=1 FL=1
MGQDWMTSDSVWECSYYTCIVEITGARGLEHIVCHLYDHLYGKIQACAAARGGYSVYWHILYFRCGTYFNLYLLSCNITKLYYLYVGWIFIKLKLTVKMSQFCFFFSIMYFREKIVNMLICFRFFSMALISNTIRDYQNF